MNRRPIHAVAPALAGQVAILLGWRPDEFWNATPAELAMILAAPAGGDHGCAPLDRAGLEQLLAAAPPMQVEHDDGR